MQQSDIVPIICQQCYWHRRQTCRRHCWYLWQIGRRYQQNQRYQWQNLPPVSLILVVHLHWPISRRLFEIILNDPNVIFGGSREDSWKKSVTKNLIPLTSGAAKIAVKNWTNWLRISVSYLLKRGLRCTGPPNSWLGQVEGGSGEVERGSGDARAQSQAGTQHATEGVSAILHGGHLKFTFTHW